MLLSLPFFKFQVSFFPCVCSKLVKNDGSLVVCRFFLTSSSLILGICFSVFFVWVMAMVAYTKPQQRNVYCISINNNSNNINIYTGQTFLVLQVLL